MNEAIRVSKEKAAKALQEYQNELLKEFLLKATSLSEKLTELIQKGVDNKYHVCLIDEEADMDYYYIFLNRKDIIEFKALLDNMKNENAIKMFENFHNTKDCFDDIYNSYSDLEDMYNIYSDYVFIESFACSL